MPTIENLLNTSVEDCRASLRNISDLALLSDLLRRCEAAGGHKSRTAAVKSRIRQLEKK